MHAAQWRAHVQHGSPAHSRGPCPGVASQWANAVGPRVAPPALWRRWPAAPGPPRQTRPPGPSLAPTLRSACGRQGRPGPVWRSTSAAGTRRQRRLQACCPARSVACRQQQAIRHASPLTILHLPRCMPSCWAWPGRICGREDACALPAPARHRRATCAGPPDGLKRHRLCGVQALLKLQHILFRKQGGATWQRGAQARRRIHEEGGQRELAGRDGAAPNRTTQHPRGRPHTCWL